MSPWLFLAVCNEEGRSQNPNPKSHPSQLWVSRLEINTTKGIQIVKTWDHVAESIGSTRLLNLQTFHLQQRYIIFTVLVSQKILTNHQPTACLISFGYKWKVCWNPSNLRLHQFWRFFFPSVRATPQIEATPAQFQPAELISWSSAENVAMFWLFNGGPSNQKHTESAICRDNKHISFKNHHPKVSGILTQPLTYTAYIGFTYLHFRVVIPGGQDSPGDAITHATFWCPRGCQVLVDP